MRQLISALWFDKEAEEAVNFYTSIFENSRIIRRETFKDTPIGDCESIDFELENLSFEAFNGGERADFNSSISIMVSMATDKEVDALYAKLSVGGVDLMPLDSYPFSERYAWVQDKYGVTWQIMVDENSAVKQKLKLNLLFSGESCGKAEAALNYYHEVFNQSEIEAISHYSEGEAEDSRAKVNYSELSINGQKLTLMDHGLGGDFNFNEAYSLMILCGSQAEIDYYWDKLSHDPDFEQCGWLKDQFGVHWQIMPVRLYELMKNGSEEEQKRVTQAMLNMKKLDIEALENAIYELS
ncbi:VOC family protein [Ruoffia tabacinasalis]|jgi:predicted 3-demethylubiquinone-9 3-methyltransferase (glyoxalase superfamily)|uniref:VOC family protein n=1 Tax=Ruoffia tabacinasalis TaxID=87458 RepID=A0ABS0LK33_9LACT|nr:VOC family protein [Ruoffia tabacinasalis]MBG9978588.1 VOC family protein [Ruoffia tabacinasalis]